MLTKNTHILETKRGTVNDTGTFSAYVSTFGLPADLQNDVIVKGAFASAIKRHKQNNTSPAMLWSHDSHEPIGAWISMIEDDYGLLVRGRLALGTKRGREAYELMKINALQFSIGFAGVVSTMHGDIRYIKQISRLAEISLVALPANENTRLVAMKNAALSKRNIERHLRENGGLSRSQAKSVAAGDWGSLFCDEQGVTKINRIICAIETLTIAIREAK